MKLIAISVLIFIITGLSAQIAPPPNNNGGSDPINPKQVETHLSAAVPQLAAVY